MQTLLTPAKRTNIAKCLMASASLLLVSGCTTTPPTDPHDPLEPLNRRIFNFNMVMDKAVFRPVAKAYDKVIPPPVDHRITNFFSNLNEIPTVVNDVLQANIPLALADTSRFAINTTVGLVGLFDPATSMGLPKHRQDFGLTLARWGYRDSMYFVIPILGPSTIRDTIAVGPDYYASVYPYISDQKLRYGLIALRSINQRAALLPADPLVDDAFDPYVFVRSAYLQRRARQIDLLLEHGRIHQEEKSYLEASAVGDTEAGNDTTLETDSANQTTDQADGNETETPEVITGDTATATSVSADPKAQESGTTADVPSQ